MSTYASWLNRIEAQFAALRYFCIDGTDHENHRQEASMIRRYIHWRNQNKQNEKLTSSHQARKRRLTRH